METPRSKLAAANCLSLETLFCVQEDLTNPGNYGVWSMLDGRFVTSPLMTESQADLYKTALNSFFRRF